jgi:hypothetical protein
MLSSLSHARAVDFPPSANVVLHHEDRTIVYCVVYTTHHVFISLSSAAVASPFVATLFETTLSKHVARQSVMATRVCQLWFGGMPIDQYQLFFGAIIHKLSYCHACIVLFTVKALLHLLGVDSTAGPVGVANYHTRYCAFITKQQMTHSI